MILLKNSFANYAGQVYNSLAILIATPFFFNFFGPETYALIGFYGLMLFWVKLLDLGLSPTLAREIATLNSRKYHIKTTYELLKSFETIFLIISIFIFILISFLSTWIASSWFSEATISVEIIKNSILLMGYIFAIRFFQSLYRSGLIGLEVQVNLNIINIISNTFRYYFPILLLIYPSFDILIFFIYQAIIETLTLLIMYKIFYKILPSSSGIYRIFHFNFAIVRRVLPFALSIALSALIWVLVSQSDKLILSSILSLKEFGYFSLIMIITNGLQLITNPLTQAVLPRLIILLKNDDEIQFKALYRDICRIVTYISFSVALIVSFLSFNILYLWTADVDTASWGDSILFWYALGNGFLGISSMQYVLQSSFGNLKLHLIGSFISLFIQVPIILYSAINYGALGAGIAWFGVRLIFFILWTPVIHKKFLPNFHFSWLLEDILPIIFLLVVTSIGLNYFFEIYAQFEINELIEIITFVSLFLSITLFFSKKLRVSLLAIISPSR